MAGNSQTSYTVVARRYRPQTFRDLVGQGHIVTALSNAILQQRVGHAYLFTGARGTGKTSSARIFAKCLNCEKGPTPEPCNECDICQSIASGEDVDVLEIDGASNRGIEEIRQLRSNVNIRPSRSRFKIYIIDEVHMLTREAFNALLKTLEEPPEHVKFIFCTTDPQKLPITVLSRCQRYDFVPVATVEITQRLSEIAVGEGVQADDAALQLIARRAAGSMRDSQSLLEQVLSFCSEKITLEDVHSLLGTADSGKIFTLAEAMLQRRSADSLRCIQDFIAEGCDPGQLANQLVGFFRDLMVFRVGGEAGLLLNVEQADLQRLNQLADQVGIETLLSGLQVLDQTLVRMRDSMHARILLEAGVLRVCELGNLQSVVEMLKQLQTTAPPGSPQPNSATARPTPAPTPAPAQAIAPALPSKPATNPSPANTPATSSGSEAKKKADLAPSHAQATSALHSVSQATANPASSGIQSTAQINQLLSASAGVEDQGFTADSSELNAVLAQSRESAAEVKTPAVTAKPVASAPSASSPVAALKPAESSSSGRLVLNPEILWRRALTELGDFTADVAADFRKVESLQPDTLTVTLGGDYQVNLCNRAERRQRVEDCLERIAGRKIRIDYVAAPASQTVERRPGPVNRRQVIRRLEQHPLVKSVIAMFDGEVTDFELPRNLADSSTAESAPPENPRD
jgi:DNA polymerase-3 subunit gamma/tau